MNPHPARKPPRRRDDRVILHFDLDCFYAQCVENQQPTLKALPLGIKQKGILATCNYEARHRGVKKLMLISEAKKICPELIIADGEDLSPFRDVSKTLYALLKSYSWCGRVERLGLDEVFLDVTDIVSYNVGLLHRNTLQKSFFCLSRDDPAKGFDCDATQVAGCIHGEVPLTQAGLENPLYMRLLLASHLARYLRSKIEEQGFTSSCGISTSKVLAKLVGNKNKPRNQTTLLALDEDNVLPFMDEHRLRAVPGIGSRITAILESFVLGIEMKTDPHTMECAVSVGEVRAHPGISPPSLEKLLSGPGSEKGLGTKVWCLLHGVDDSPVKPGRDVPTQISIEDTYKGLNGPGEIRRELTLISTSLLRRMRVDLIDTGAHEGEVTGPGTQPKAKWTAYPRTIRLTTRPYTSPSDGNPYNWSRMSRSGPLPSFVFSSTMSREAIVEKLVAETLLPMFYKLNPGPRGWNTGLINICVTNMSGTDGGVASGRDIGAMFRRQVHVLREFTVYDADESSPTPEVAVSQSTQVRTKDDTGICVSTSEVSVTSEADDGGSKPGEAGVYTRQEDNGFHGYDDSSEDVDEDGSWVPEQEHDQRDGTEQCPLCGHFIPLFALTAHDRFHRLQNVGG